MLWFLFGVACFSVYAIVDFYGKWYAYLFLFSSIFALLNSLEHKILAYKDREK